MKNKKLFIGLALILIVVVGISAYINQKNRPSKEVGQLSLIIEGSEKMLPILEDDLQEVTGEILNGKGEIKEISGQMIEIKTLLAKNAITNYTEVAFEADDAYRISISEDELQEDEKFYLQVEEEQFNLVVFGDSNAKRNVRNLVQIVVE